jgi:hypothetical protein
MEGPAVRRWDLLSHATLRLMDVAIIRCSPCAINAVKFPFRIVYVRTLR